MDTIAAIATAAGEAAVSIVRISGPQSIEAAKALFRRKDKKPVPTFKPNQMMYGFIVDSDEQIIDEVYVVYFKAPYSYTCEDVVEIHTHGSRISLERTLQRIYAMNIRPAERGEFTQRAFLNGRLDLTQAEAVMDLITSRTKQGFDIAMQQLGGKLQHRVTELKVQLMQLMAHLEVCMDYPEEDIEDVTYESLKSSIQKLLHEIYAIEADGKSGKLLKEGIKVVIIGKPNVGKSSLLNALLRENRAIVTDIPGTTRDSIEEVMHIRGLPLRLVDTAGLRETEDLIEHMGVERSRALFNEADVVLLVLNVNEVLTQEDIHLFEVLNGRPTILILNKMDLDFVIDEEELLKHFKPDQFVRTSILNEEGLAALEQVLYHSVLGEAEVSTHGIMTNSRQLSALSLSKVSLEQALAQVHALTPYAYIMIDLEDAKRHFEEITGDFVDEEILNAIFSSFCLGK